MLTTNNFQTTANLTIPLTPLYKTQKLSRITSSFPLDTALEISSHFIS